MTSPEYTKAMILVWEIIKATSRLSQFLTSKERHASSMSSLAPSGSGRTKEAVWQTKQVDSHALSICLALAIGLIGDPKRARMEPKYLFRGKF